MSNMHSASLCRRDDWLLGPGMGDAGNDGDSAQSDDASDPSRVGTRRVLAEVETLQGV